MRNYSQVRRFQRGEKNPKSLSLDVSGLVNQMESFACNYDLTRSTPRSLKRFDSLYSSDFDAQIDAEPRAASTGPSPAQTVVPHEFDSSHEWQDGKCSGVDPEPYRRRSEPQVNAPYTKIWQERNFQPSFRHSSPVINWEFIDGQDFNHHPPSFSRALLSTRDPPLEESTGLLFKLHDIADEGRLRLEQLNRKVLLAIETQPVGRRRSSAEMSVSSQRRDSEQIRSIGGHDNPVRSALGTEYIPPDPGRPLYRPLARPESQIRLFGLARVSQYREISGSFVYSDIKSCPKYTALSYAWGEPMKTRKITIEGQDDIEIGENLWWFLYCRGVAMKKPRLFYIDAICINQSNVNERNHQVRLMKRIYSMASNVYIWLGRESGNSRLAMEYLANEGMKRQRQPANDHQSIWEIQEAEAVRDLFERHYWRRMWIIQEIIHAKNLTVWCGSQRVDWPVLDRLYLTMKAIEGRDQLCHHAFATDIMRSPALVMVWQRAHWRHAETPTPKLQTLIEIFQGWECTDIRDKVYALVSMADRKTAVLPDYSCSPNRIYQDVLRQGVACDNRFRTLLARVLGISQQHQD